MYADWYIKLADGHGVMSLVSERWDMEYIECMEIGARNLRILKISMNV